MTKQNHLKSKYKYFKKRDFLDEYWHMGYYHDDKELNLKIFKAKAAQILNDLAALADKLINTTNKEEN